MILRIAALSLALAGVPAQAQFPPYANPNNQPFRGYYNTNPLINGTVGFYYSGILPVANGVGARYTTGPTGTTYATSFSVQPFTLLPQFVPGKLSNFGGGTLGVPESASQPVLDRQKREIASAQAQASYQALTGEANTQVSKWVAEQGANTGVVDPLTAVDPTLINPTEDALASGLALNELAGRIAALEAKGKKAKTGLCSPEFLEKIAFVGGPPAEVLNLFHRQSKPKFPELIPEETSLDALNAAYTPVAAALFAGKKALPADAAKLQEANAQLRLALEPVAAKATIPEAGKLLSFFNALDTAAKFSTEADAAGVLNAKWASVGANISDLVKQMAKLKVRFGRAAAGDELIYATLHRAMLTHYATLAQMK